MERWLRLKKPCKKPRANASNAQDWPGAFARPDENGSTSKRSTKQSHQSAVLTLLKVGQSERDPARPEKCAVAHCHVHSDDRSHPQTLSEGDAPPHSAIKNALAIAKCLDTTPFRFSPPFRVSWLAPTIQIDNSNK